MRYQVLIPPAPMDPRMLKLESLDALLKVAPEASVHLTETGTSQHIRHRWPDAVAMPMPVAIGSGDCMLLAIVADPTRLIGADVMIPCVAFVRPMADNDAEKRSMKRNPGKIFSRGLWKVPVIKPELNALHRVEIRANDLEVPMFTGARVGYHEGRLTIYVEVGESEMSIRFEDPRLQIVSGVPTTVDVDDVEGNELDRLGGV